MSYKIAVGSSDGINIDLKFGEAKKMLIFEVDGEKRKLLEIRKVDTYTTAIDNGCDGYAGGCSSLGCSGNGNGCNGSADVMGKVELVRDCRCIVCKKTGFQAQKQLEKKAISVFDIEGSIDPILEKIIAYYGKIDKRRTQRQKNTDF